MAQAHESITSQLEGAKSGMLRPHPLSPDQNTSDSLLGNPPSLPEDLTCEKASVSLTDFVEVFEERFDDAVASIYVSTLQDPLSYIIEEKLDDKEVMLMDGKLKIVIPLIRSCISRSFCPGVMRTSLDNYYWPLFVGVHADLNFSPKHATSDGTPKRAHCIPRGHADFCHINTRAWLS